MEQLAIYCTNANDLNTLFSAVIAAGLLKPSWWKPLQLAWC